MKVRNTVFYAVWLIVLALLQPTLIQWIRIFGCSPDMFLIFVVCTGLIMGKQHAAVIGFIFGLVFDFNVGRMIGLSAALYMLLGYGIGMVKEKFVSESRIVCVFITAISCILYSVFYYIGYSVAWGELGFFTALFRIIFPKAIYSALVVLILYSPIKKSFLIINKRKYDF